MEELKERLQKDGWMLSFAQDKIWVYKPDANGEKNPYQTYCCDSDGFYTNLDRENHVRVASLGSCEKNFVGLYCFLDSDKYGVKNKTGWDDGLISDRTSVDELYQIYSKYLDIDYIKANLNWNANCEVNDGFQLRIDGEWLAIRYVLGSYDIVITEVNGYDILYKHLLPYLLLKKTFEEKVVPFLPAACREEKSILEFYHLYAKGSFQRATEKQAEPA